VKICSNCGNKLNDEEKKCPVCKTNAKSAIPVDENDKERIDEVVASVRAKGNNKPKKKSKLLPVIIVIIVLAIIGSIGGGDDTQETNAPDSSSQISTNDKSQSTKEDKKVAENVPKEYQSALKKADSYANDMHMSKAGLYDQLISEYGEDFTEEAAQYAIDNVKTDWKENALKKAISYQDNMSMSPNSIYDQLISEHGEKFTEEESRYAIENLPK